MSDYHRVVTLSGVVDGVPREKTVSMPHELPVKMAEWNAKTDLEREGWVDVDVIESEFTQRE